MLFPLVNLSEWVHRYGLTINTRVCLGCKKEFTANIPIAIKGYRGLQAPLHECGNKYQYSILTPIDSEEIKFWIDFKYGA